MMRSRKTKCLIVAVGLLLLFSLCSGLLSCHRGGGSAEDPTESGSGSGTESDAQKGTELKLAGPTKSLYTIVRPSDCSAVLSKNVSALADALEDLTGVRFLSVTDETWETEPPSSDGAEIMIGNCYRRDTVNALQNVRYNDYTICLSGENLLVAAHSDEAAIKGVQRLITMLKSNTVKTDDGSVLTWQGDYAYHALGYRLEDRITVQDVPIASYRIVYPAQDDLAKDVADSVMRVIGEASGNVLPMVPDTEAETEYEIRIGATNRSSAAGQGSLAAGQYQLLTQNGTVYFLGTASVLATAAVTEFKTYLDAQKGVLDNMNIRKSLIDSGDFVSNAADIRIMEYNVLVEFPGWGSGGEIPSDVNLRKDIIAGLINGYSPDVLCLCEFFDTWRQELPPLLDSKYQFVCIDRPDGSSNRTSLVYNSETVTLIEGGYEDISLHPNTDAAWPDDVNHRVVMWGVFEVKATGKRFMTLGTHYTSTSSSAEHLEEQKVMQAEMTLQRLASLKAQYDVPAIILGDLNTAKGSDCYTTLQRGTGFDDVADAFPGDYLADHIFYDPSGLALENAILEKGKKANVASDHKPMIADFAFLR